VRFLQKIYGEKIIYNYVYKAMAWKYNDNRNEDYLRTTLPKNVLSNLSYFVSEGILKRSRVINEENGKKMYAYWDPFIPLK